MTTESSDHGLQLRSLVTPAGQLEVSLVRTPTQAPGDDEIVVRIEATPINPSDIGLLFGPANLGTLQTSGSDDAPAVTADIPERAMTMMAGRLNQALPVGNEGAGTVVRAGASPQAQSLMGRKVAILGGAMYAEYRTVKAADALLLPAHTLPAEDRARGRRRAPATGGRGAEDHLRQPLHVRDFAEGRAEAGRDRRLCAAGDRREVSDQPDPALSAGG